MDVNVKRAQDAFKQDKDHWQPIYNKAKDDLKFLSDDECAQWNEADYAARMGSGRPTLTIDQLGQFVHQVVNDIRINTPTINVIPAGYGADNDTSEVFKGLIKNIEYTSNADNAYDMAANYAVRCSIGYIRVDHEYEDEKSFNQRLCIKRVINPLAVYLDRNSVEPDASDAKHGFILDTLTKAEFQKQYKGKAPVPFGEDEEVGEDEDVVLCEYFEIEETEQELEQDGQTRTISSRVVKRYLLSGADTLEETTFPGKYIPIVPVYGEETWQDGKRQLKSLIRGSKQAQQMFNYWKSLETELLMKQPQAPVLAAAGSIENYQDDWVNPDKSMALRYDHVDEDGNPNPPPQRLDPPTIPVGVVNASRQTVDDIKATMGIYNAALGQHSNEVSGVAINQRKLESDVATYHFSDNLMKSITHVGRILVEAIPTIYDTERIVRIIGEEDQPKEVGINGARAEEQTDEFNLAEGKYDVRVVTGASFTTRRQEAAQFYTDIFKSHPDYMNIMGDLMFENQDFTGAQAMAERMKKVIDPKFLDDEEQDPEKAQMAQALEEAGLQIQALQTELADKQSNEQAKMQLEQFKIQTDIQQAQIDAALEQEKLSLERDKIELEKLKLQAEIGARMQPTDIPPGGGMQ